MPPLFDLAQQPCGDDWMLLEEIESPVLDTMICQAGWHFGCLQGSYSRLGVGLSRHEAIHQALARALKGLQVRFNAAEIESIEVSRNPGLYIATVSLQPRYLQQHSSLEMAVEHHA